MDDGKFYAHTSKTKNWEILSEHLQKTAEIAEGFGKNFHSSQWCRIAGLWHDLGKYSDLFQDYLQAKNMDSHESEIKGKVDHSTAGAQWAKEKYGTTGLVLAHIIAAHHSGLLDYSSNRSSLEKRLEKKIEDWKTNAPEDILELKQPSIPQLHFTENYRENSFIVSFWLRMLYSCLVDADFLATEGYMDEQKSSQRPEIPENILQYMDQILDDHMVSLQEDSDDTLMNTIRQRILEVCQKKACSNTGFFDLCVPTGGGKTLASLNFALKHAIVNNLRRVIVAIPFTSIIEQNADVYRNIFQNLGSDVVLEHHSNTKMNEENYTNRLQSENWDAPLIVTTNVQLFESLFSNKSSKCRKLHRISSSVIVLDEAQMLPIELLRPTLLALKELVRNYNCTVVLCSATKPAFDKHEDFPIGIENVHTLVDMDEDTIIAMKRTRVILAGSLCDDDLAKELKEQEQVLCVVNTRRHASTLANLLGEAEGHFHLSTRMCPAHRKFVFDLVRKKLKDGSICRVISTQLIEAGVDVDFPSVFRAECGLDSLIQAAGRCNREGLREEGKVVFFQAKDFPPPPGMLRQAADSGKEIIGQYSDPMALEAIEAYFQLHYWKQNDQWDKYNIIHESTIPSNTSGMQFNFTTMAEHYKFIRENSSAILIPWGNKGKVFKEQLQKNYPPTRQEWREMQRYCISIRSDELKALFNNRAIGLYHERWVLLEDELYDDKLGLVADNVRTHEQYIV